MKCILYLLLRYAFNIPDNLSAARETNTDREAGDAANEMIDHENQKNKFKGIPASCKDLQILGHKLNGFYSIKKSQPKQGIAKIETVFCDFQSTSDAKGKIYILFCHIFHPRLGSYSYFYFYTYKLRGRI